LTLPFRYILGALIALLLSAPPAPIPAARAAPPADRPPVLSGIHAWTNEIYTRVAIYTGGEVNWQADTVLADPARKLPPRIFVDIRGVGIQSDILHNPVGVNNGLLRQVRAGRYSRDTVRVVIDLERPSTFRVFALPDPYRIIIDIDGEGEIPAPREPSSAEAADPAPPPAPETPPPASVEQGPFLSSAPPLPVTSLRRNRIRVMIDPGHGGKDPGAIGPTGLKEKDVVLEIGRMVRDRLSRHEAYEIRMTRDSDIFLPLEERTAMANRSRADIFVSLHINASRNRNAKGISTFVFSRGASNQEDLELAARENGVPVARLKGVKFIIDDMFTGARKNESLKLAKTMNDAICRSVSSEFGRQENLGLKQAPFFVLVGARMTSVLVETSFISNAQEEARLRDEGYLGRIADGIVEAVRYYGQNGIISRQGL
jgi:N-acetylmuramoyl-L-alanine amidase